MEIRYNQTVKDYYNAHKYIGKHLNLSTKWRYLASLTGGAFGLLAALGLISIGKHYDKFGSFGTEELNFGLLAIGAAIAILIIGLSIYNCKVKPLIFEPNGLYLSPLVFEITSDYLLHRMGDNLHQFQWKYIRVVEQANNYIFIFIDRGAALYVPRHAFESDELFDQFFQELKSHASE